MPLPAAILSHGDTDFRLRSDTPRRRSKQIDELEQTWCMSSADAYTIGAAPPDYPNMRIVDIDPTDTFEGSSHALRLQCEGILDDSTHLVLGFDADCPETGWDILNVTALTATPAATRWQKGQRWQSDPITGITGEADDEKLTKASAFASLTTGQMAYADFTSGFTGLTSGTAYYIIAVDSSNIKLATTYANAIANTAINITGDGTDLTLRPVPLGYERLFIVGRRLRQARASGYYELDLQFAGLNSVTGESKPAKRTYNVGGQTITADYYTQNYDRDIYTGAYPPSDSGSNATLAVTKDNVVGFEPTVQVTDTIIATDDDWTAFVGRHWTPENAPEIDGFDYDTGALKHTTIYNLPWGWFCSAAVGDKIPGHELYLINLTWTKQKQKTIGPNRPPRPTWDSGTSAWKLEAP